MSLGIVIFLVVLGLLLFLVEFMLLPGVTVAGIGGAISMTGAVVLAFYYHGNLIGFLVLGAVVLLVVVTVMVMLKWGTWKKFMLTREIDGKVDLVRAEEGRVSNGDTGRTITRLNPMGKVMVNGEFYEARSLDRYVDQNVDIEVIKIEQNRLIVKQIN
ncbi:MAG: NfeD family protein [Bacteroidales bacterium]